MQGLASQSPHARQLWLVIGAAALAAGIAGYVLLRLRAKPVKFNAVDVTGADWGREFHLTDPTGRPCALAQARRLMGADAHRVQGLFVTVDPKRDTPQLLANYVTAFDRSFLGLYGDDTATERAANEFKIYYHAQAPDAHGAYSVDHSGQIYVIDAQGRLRLYIRSHDATPESVAHDLRLLIGRGTG
jgi:protein SCO1